MGLGQWRLTWLVVVAVVVWSSTDGHRVGAQNWLAQPTVIDSSSGKLETSLVMDLGPFTARTEGTTIQMSTRMLNRTVPGPTLRVRAGDELSIVFHNQLQKQATAVAAHNQFSHPDEANIHFHGLFVSGELPSDDVTHVVGPGESYHYRTQLPADHMPGTHWLHPHRHGSSSLQVGGGAALALIVDDPAGFLPTQVANAEELVMVVQQFDLAETRDVAAQSGDRLFSATSTINEFLLVNGALRPVIRATAGKWQRWRVIYGGWRNGDLLDLEVPGCDMKLLAKDGIYIQDFPRTITMARIPLGGRADVMVRCAAEGDVQARSYLGIFATVRVSALPVGQTADADLSNWDLTYPDYLNDLRNTDPTPGCSCDTDLDDDSVNGIAFPENLAPLHESVLGNVVQRNLDGDGGGGGGDGDGDGGRRQGGGGGGGGGGGHPYHQHVYPFQLVQIGGNQGPYNQIGDWHDVYQGGGVVRYHPRRYTGKIMLHCHRLEHEDEGMMAIEMIKETGECTCTAAPGPPAWVIAVAVVGGLLGCCCLCGIPAWYLYRQRNSANAPKEPPHTQAAEVSADKDPEKGVTEEANVDQH